VLQQRISDDIKLFITVHKTLLILRNLVTGRFAPSTVRPLDVSPPGRFAAGRIRRFLIIQLKPKHHRLDVLTTHITVSVCHAELKSYLLTYQGAKRLGGETSRGELTKGRNVHKSGILQ